MKKLIFLMLFLSALDLSAQMNFQWIRKFNVGGTVNESRLITTDVSGNIYVCCYTNKFGTGLDIVTIKYNTNGDSLWTRRYNDSLNLDDMPKDIKVDSENNVIIAGNTGTSPTALDGLLIKYNINGSIIWVKTYNGVGNKSDDFRQIALDNLNNIYAVGSTANATSTELRCLTVKYDASGNKLWESKYGMIPYGVDYGYAIKIDPTNQFCFVGAQNDIVTEGIQITLIKYGCNAGDSLWIKRYPAAGAGTWFSSRTGKIVVDNSGYAHFATFTGDNTQYHEFLLIKYTPFGDTAWVRTYGEVSGAGDEIRDIKIDNSKNVFITGASNIGNNTNWSTIKYDSSGNRKWVNVYNRANYFDEPCGLYFDKAGNILVGGYGTVTTLPYTDYVVNKYNPSNGALINSYIYTNNYYDYCYAMAKDTADNVYLTGNFSTSSSVWDLATMKLSPTTGITQISTEIPASFNLDQNYPNPFNPSTTIRFQCAKEGKTQLKVFDLTGREITTLVNEYLQPGTYQVRFEARQGGSSTLSSGIYFYQLKTEIFLETKKMILIK